MNRFLKFAALTLALPLFLSTYSSADSFTFTGTAGTGNDQKALAFREFRFSSIPSSTGRLAGVLFSVLKL